MTLSYVHPTSDSPWGTYLSGEENFHNYFTAPTERSAHEKIRELGNVRAAARRRAEPVPARRGSARRREHRAVAAGRVLLARNLSPVEHLSEPSTLQRGEARRRVARTLGIGGCCRSDRLRRQRRLGRDFGSRHFDAASVRSLCCLLSRRPASLRRLGCRGFFGLCGTVVGILGVGLVHASAAAGLGR